MAATPPENRTHAFHTPTDIQPCASSAIKPTTAPSSTQPFNLTAPPAASRAIFGDFSVTDELVTPGKLLAPLAPTAIFCIGLNYRKHAEESNAAIPQYPVLFMKSPGAVQNPGDDIVLPRHLASDEVDYECELAVVIGKACKNVSKANALDYVLGYTCANDVSARDWQIKRGGGPMVPWRKPSTLLRRLAHVWCSRTRSLIQTRCASRPSSMAKRWQDWNTNDMIFDVPALHRVPQRQHHAAARHCHPHRHAPRRRRSHEAPCFPPIWRHCHHRHEKIGALTNPVVAESNA